MGFMKEIDIAVKSGENIDEARNRVLQAKERNRKAQEKPQNPFTVDLTPYNRWVVKHTEYDGKVTIIADRIPSRNLAEKALKWFMEGKYRRYKMGWLKDPSQKQPNLFVSSAWFHEPRKIGGRLSDPLFEEDQPPPSLMRKIRARMSGFFKGIL